MEQKPRQEPIMNHPPTPAEIKAAMGVGDINRRLTPEEARTARLASGYDYELPKNPEVVDKNFQHPNNQEQDDIEPFIEPEEERTITPERHKELLKMIAKEDEQRLKIGGLAIGEHSSEGSESRTNFS